MMKLVSEVAISDENSDNGDLLDCTTVYGNWLFTLTTIVQCGAVKLTTD